MKIWTPWKSIPVWYMGDLFHTGAYTNSILKQQTTIQYLGITTDYTTQMVTTTEYLVRLLYHVHMSIKIPQLTSRMSMFYKFLNNHDRHSLSSYIRSRRKLLKEALPIIITLLSTVICETIWASSLVWILKVWNIGSNKIVFLVYISV